jgi:MFS family permease
VSQQATAVPPGGAGGIHPGRLFGASCVALISTAVVFMVAGAILGDLKKYFVLDNAQVGWIKGATMWGFTLSIFAFGPLVDWLGMKLLMRVAFLFHVVGVLMMVFASGFAMLFVGGLIIALGNGTVEAVCNPMIATIYPNDKTHKLSQFHMWFPGGQVIAGLLAFALGKMGLEGNPHLWQIQLGIVLVPAVIYAILFTGQKFPKTERVQAGISFGGMVKATVLSPLFIVLFICMAITASLELGTTSWIINVLEAGGIPGILVLVWITGLMAILRGSAGPIIHKFSNTGLLLISAILSGIGLEALGFMKEITTATGMPELVVAGVAATIFAFGVCFFWPTMLGTAAERVPKGGSLALALLGGWGMLIVGFTAAPWMGQIIDQRVHVVLTENGASVKTAAILTDAATSYKALAEAQPATEAGKIFKDELLHAVNANMQPVLDQWAKNNTLPEPGAANALRAVVGTGPDAKAGKEGSELEKKAWAAKEAVGKVLNPAENDGGLLSFRYIAPFALIIVLVFGVMYFRDRSRGGYKAEKIVAEGLAEGFADGVPPSRLK